MNIIQIVSDTFRRDHLGCYGNKWIHTKNLNAFAENSIVFNNAYVASFPTIPQRHDLFTGRYTFLYSRWGPLPRDEVILSQSLRQSGYTTMLIADTFHMMNDGFHYDRGFDGWWWIRGQERDRYMTHPSKETNEKKKILSEQYLRNVSMRRFESDYFVAQTMASAEKWLELNYNQHRNFFLHIDTFDPHEAWDPPKWYSSMYDPDWKGGIVPGIAGILGRVNVASDLNRDQLKQLRALYAGEVTLVDRWIGRLLQKIEDLGLFENTIVIFTTDHGTLLGEHNWIGKKELYEEVAHIPLVMRMPDSMGRNHGYCDGLVQVPDIMPTILDFANTPIPDTVQGKSLLPLIHKEEAWQREIAVSNLRTVTSKEWSFLVPGIVTRRQKQVKLKPELYHLRKDPRQRNNLYEQRREVADELFPKMIQFLKSLGANEKTLESLG